MSRPFSSIRQPRRSAGFTLIEVLATILLMGIALPAIMGAISTATRAGATARHRNEASMLAQSKLNELIATGLWQTGENAGDFIEENFPDYRWELQVNGWTEANVEQLDLRVYWLGPGDIEQDVVLSTLVYPGSGTGTTGNGTTGTGGTTTGGTP